MNEQKAVDTLTFYKSGILNRGWRWRYRSGGNFSNLANGGESYEKLEDAMKAAFRVLGLDGPYETDGTSSLVGSTDTVLTRGNGYDIEVKFTD